MALHLNERREREERIKNELGKLGGDFERSIAIELHKRLNIPLASIYKNKEVSERVKAKAQQRRDVSVNDNYEKIEQLGYGLTVRMGKHNTAFLDVYVDNERVHFIEFRPNGKTKKVLVEYVKRAYPKTAIDRAMCEIIAWHGTR
jgi:hypothetical protein